MAVKITVTLDEDVIRKLHELQAKQIKDSKKAVSFSSIINEVLRKIL